MRTPSSVPKPPLLINPAQPSEAAPSADPGAAPEPLQASTLREMLARSDASVRLIDAGRFGELWAGAAPFLQTSGQGERILAGIAQARAALGPVQGRGRAGTQGVQALRAGPQSQLPPPGQYANVEYTARLADGGSAIERLSFKQESDGWRFVGYTAQALPAAPSVGAGPGAAPAR